MPAPPTVHDFGRGPEPVWYTFDATYTPAAGRWPLRVSCCAVGPIAAVRKMRRAFPPEPGTRLARLDWSPLAPLSQPPEWHCVDCDRDYPAPIQSHAVYHTP